MIELPRDKYQLRAAFSPIAMGAVAYLSLPNSIAGSLLALATSFVALKIISGSDEQPKEEYLRLFSRRLTTGLDTQENDLVETVTALSTKANITPPNIHVSSNTLDIIAGVLKGTLLLDSTAFDTDLIKPEELEGVLAHEISHLRDRYPHNDIALIALTRLTQLSLLFSSFESASLPEAALKVFVAIYACPRLHRYAAHQQEYSADMGSVTLTGTTRGLLSLFTRVASSPNYEDDALHPPLKDRIKALEKLALRHPELA